jgi:hypothetical protein
LFRAVTSRVPGGVEIAATGKPGHDDRARAAAAPVAPLLDWH